MLRFVAAAFATDVTLFCVLRHSHYAADADYADAFHYFFVPPR